MHGILYVWCGPFQRWRERYGIIDNGHLDIYPSVDSKSTNLLESHYIACANVTPVSSSALEWIIHSPGKSSAYFKVTTPEERRRWLKLLGSAKACIADSSALMARYDSDTGKSISNQQLNSQYEEVLTKIDYKECKTEETTVKEDVAIEYSSIRAIISLSEDIKSELCDVQKHCKEGFDHVNITYLQTKEKEISNLWTNVKGMIASFSPHTEDCETSHSESLGDRIRDGNPTKDEQIESQIHQTPITRKVDVSTFFTQIQVCFADVMAEATQRTESTLVCSIQSLSFMEACIEHAKLFDLIAGSLLAPLRNDVLSNTEKIRAKYLKNANKYTYLQRIFDDEIQDKVNLNPNSATQAIVWMMRGLRTISTFLCTVCSRNHHLYKDTSGALSVAYEDHLKRYHNFFVQKMFTAGLKFLPSMDHFKQQLVLDKTCDVASKVVENEIMEQIISYSQSMVDIVQDLEKVFIHHNIDF